MYAETGAPSLHTSLQPFIDRPTSVAGATETWFSFYIDHYMCLIVIGLVNYGIGRSGQHCGRGRDRGRLNTGQAYHLIRDGAFKRNTPVYFCT